MTPIHQKKIMMINDLSGYGRCSLTVAIPILAALKVQCQTDGNCGAGDFNVSKAFRQGSD